jgi:tetratricopeptide (TPR) repeat protein
MRQLALAGAVFGVALAAHATAFAQAPGPAVSNDYDALLAQMLKDPSNLDVTFRYAELATQRGDYEAAIGALERMLFYNANLPRVKIELGALYFRLGSYAMAKSYLEAAIAGDVPPEVKAKVNVFLAEIARRTSPDQFSAFAWMGARYQTNANAGPSSTLVPVLGQNVTLMGQFAKQPDWNSFAFASFGYSHDLGNQRGDTIEATGLGYYSKQFLAEQFDLGIAELQIGPRFALFPETITGASLKVYGIANTVALGGSQYFNTLGTGVSSRFQLGVFTVVEPSFEYRHRDFFDTANFPTAGLQSGNLMTTAIAAEGLIPGWTKWAVRLAYDRNDAVSDPFTYDRWSIDVGIPIAFTTYWGGARQWVVTPNVGYSWTNYAAPDPTVDPVIVQRDRELRVGGTVDMQIHENIGVRTQLQYIRIMSDLANYDTSNFSVAVGPTLRF